jgi:hypothetical protein
MYTYRYKDIISSYILQFSAHLIRDKNRARKHTI